MTSVEIQRSATINGIIRKRVNDFTILGKTRHCLFDFSYFIDLKIKATLETEIAFCLSAANSSAFSSLQFQKMLEHKNLEDLSRNDLCILLKSAHVRFHNKKAHYIFDALRKFDDVTPLLKMNSVDARQILVNNFNGLGFKEASHFLRNIGRKNIAIIDRHILKFLYNTYSLSDSFTNLSPKQYEELENVLKRMSMSHNMNLAEYDLYIWYTSTGKIFK